MLHIDQRLPTCKKMTPGHQSQLFLSGSSWENVCASEKRVSLSSNVPNGHPWNHMCMENQVNLLEIACVWSFVSVEMSFQRRMDFWILWTLVMFSELLWIFICKTVSSWNLRDGRNQEKEVNDKIAETILIGLMVLFLFFSYAFLSPMVGFFNSKAREHKY